MPPKKAKGRKRGSTEERINDFDKQKCDSPGEVTDLLSPSEVVKMRKKVRPLPAQESPIAKDQSKDRELKNPNKSKTNRVIEKNVKKEIDKKKDVLKPKKERSEKENELKKLKPFKEKKFFGKKKLKTDDSDCEPVVPILYPCGICTKEVSDADDAILCEAGCEYWYHRNCTGMTDIAYQLLTNEDNAEWVCDKCIATKSVPLIKFKGE